MICEMNRLRIIYEIISVLICHKYYSNNQSNSFASGLPNGVLKIFVDKNSVSYMDIC